MICHAVSRVLENRAAELEILERDPGPLRRIQAPLPPGYLRRGQPRSWPARGPASRREKISGRRTKRRSPKDPGPTTLRHPLSVRDQGVFTWSPTRVRPDRVLCLDIIAPEGYGEVVGGGQRIHDQELLRRRVREHGLPEDAFEWYLDLRRYGTTPHSGFGLGIERFVAWMSGLSHLREAIAFPRTLYRLAP